MLCNFVSLIGVIEQSVKQFWFCFFIFFLLLLGMVVCLPRGENTMLLLGFIDSLYSSARILLSNMHETDYLAQ